MKTETPHDVSPSAAICAARIEPVMIELPPDLPMPAFTSTSSFDVQRVGALAVYCSDGRYGDAFDDFCHRRLDIPRYDRLAVPGGPAWLAHGGDRPDLLKAAREQMEFLVTAHDLRRIVLIAHWGCAFYTSRGGGKPRAPRECLPEQLRDIGHAAKALSVWFPSVSVEGYLAMQNVGAVSFYGIERDVPRAATRPVAPPPPILARGTQSAAARVTASSARALERSAAASTARSGRTGS
jgi:hypothetical protein